MKPSLILMTIGLLVMLAGVSEVIYERKAKANAGTAIGTLQVTGPTPAIGSYTITNPVPGIRGGKSLSIPTACPAGGHHAAYHAQDDIDWEGEWSLMRYTLKGKVKTLTQDFEVCAKCGLIYLESAIVSDSEVKQ